MHNVWPTRTFSEIHLTLKEVPCNMSIELHQDDKNPNVTQKPQYCINAIIAMSAIWIS